CISTWLPNIANAGAWLIGKGKHELSLDYLYSLPYKSNSSSTDDNGLDGLFTYRVQNEISSSNIAFDYEYGVSDQLSFLAFLSITRYSDAMRLVSDVDGITQSSAKLSSDYYQIVPEIGLKGSIYDNKKNTAVSYKLYFASGDMMVGDSTTSYIGRTASTKAALLYGYSFNLPFIPYSEDRLAHYIDMSAEYQFYHQNCNHQFNTEALIGMKPWGNEWTLLTALYSTFNGYNYSKREIARSKVSKTIDSFGLPSDYNAVLKNDALNSLVSDGHSGYHQLSFQVGYDINEHDTIYLKSFHNVFIDKPFKFNSFLLSLDYKF
ncbi:MAG: hypothetical protein LW826_06810, partial [Candidatus Jidaibacter sp.]|nr:hypothetical protein [Candidatus Jidaibacter sp.]